jgi:hypothetical protein
MRRDTLNRRHALLGGATPAASSAIPGGGATAEGSMGKEDRLVAIDVLLEPDRWMLEAAEQWNKRLREQIPEGLALDETHRPHITLLQQYGGEKDLDAVVAAVKSLATQCTSAA